MGLGTYYIIYILANMGGFLGGQGVQGSISRISREQQGYYLIITQGTNWDLGPSPSIRFNTIAYSVLALQLVFIIPYTPFYYLGLIVISTQGLIILVADFQDPFIAFQYRKQGIL